MDVCNQTADFLVTAMDYIDTENIAISVLRSWPSLINPRTLKPLNPNDGITRTVTYFLNTITMQLREDVAWSSEVPQAVFTQGQLCPVQRRTPNFGSMTTEIIVAGLLFIRMPFNIILNGVYIFDKWTQPRGDNCPTITYGHSQLLTACGSNAFSLKTFFDSLETANQLLFRSISIIARAFKGLPGSAMPITFLNGIKMFGENTMDPLVSAVVGGTIFHKSFQIPLQKSSMDIMSSAFRMPGIMRMFVLAGSPLAWVDFLYHFVVDLIYRAVRAAYKPGVRPESVFYATMYDFQQQFDEVVASNTHKACTGLSLAMGYTNPWARIIRTQCDAWASVPSGMLQFLNVFLVDIPTAQCLCKDAHGSNFHRYATDVCIPNSPSPIRPMIQAMVDADDLNIKDACTLIVRYTTAQMQDSFQEFFDNQFECSSNIGSSLDYMLRIGTQRTPNDDLCTNFQVITKQAFPQTFP